MAQKKTVKSLRVDSMLEKRIASYCAASGMKEAEALRHLLERGLSCEALSVFATPVGSLIRDVVEAEFSLLRSELDERNDNLEERLARICARGTKASLHAAAQLNDVSRAIIPAWQQVPAEDLWAHYSRVGGAIQSGRPYKEAKDNQ